MRSQLVVAAASAADELVRFPSAEELRMVRAIALLALLDAARYGAYRATFHGFCVDARRKAPPPGIDTAVDVYFCVSLGKIVVERGLVATINAEAMEPTPRVAVI